MGKCKQANQFQLCHYGHLIINYSWEIDAIQRNFEEILQHFKKYTKKISSLLNVTAGYLCVQSLPEWAWMFVSVLKR